MANTLFLRLEAPLQSWGERAQWSERDTAPEPTKSGIVGLFACALGWDDDLRIRELSRSIRVGVRCDFMANPFVLMDYHTVGGGYLSPQLLTGEGKPKLSKGLPHTEPTKRYYLCDAAFLVAIQANPVRVQALSEAVQSPVWPVFLGRKCCVPTRPLFDGVGEYASLEAALQAQPAHLLVRHPAIETQKTLSTRVTLECDPSDGGAVRRRDAVLASSLRIFGPRYSRELQLADISIKVLEEA